MESISELRSILGKFFKGNKSRLDCFAQLLLTLIAVRTVNLRELAVGMQSNVQIDSRYKRIKRFMAQVNLDKKLVARWILSLFFSADKQLLLTIDRTNWCWGKTKLNVLLLGVAYEGLSIPVCWQWLDKKGNASAKEHRAIMEDFIALFGKNCIAGILADREFASAELIHWLYQQQLPFYIRIRHNTIIQQQGQFFAKAQWLFKSLTPKAMDTYPKAVFMFGQQLYLAGARSERGELLLVATNQSPQQAIALYLRRWEIESLFQSLKSRGFQFEQTHLTHLARIDKLMTLLAIGFCWAHKVGQWRDISKPIPFNHHRHSFRPQFSYFRYSPDLLRDMILHPNHKKTLLKCCLQLIDIPLIAHSTCAGAL